MYRNRSVIVICVLTFIYAYFSVWPIDTNYYLGYFFNTFVIIYMIMKMEGQWSKRCINMNIA